MAVQKDVLIAGGVVVICVALVVVALVATKKDKPAPPAPELTTTSYPPAADPTGGFGATGTSTYGASGASSSVAPVSDPYGSSFGSTASSGTSPLAPAPSPMDAESPFGTSSSGSLTPSTGLSPLAGGPASTSSSYGGTSAAPVLSPVTPATEVAGGGTHSVAKGETLGDISAAHYGTTKHWRKIVEANPGLDPARLKIGQVIQLPVIETSAPASTGAVAGGPDTYTVQKGDSYYTVAKRKLGAASRWRELERLNGIPAEDLKVGTVLKLPAKLESAATGPAGPALGGGKAHIVAKGETLGDISKQYFGTTTKWKAILEANPGVRPENLKVGQSLSIPDLPVVAPATGAVTAPVGGSAYTVKSGDTLESIAAAQLGRKSAWKQIVEVNPGLKPTSLRIGQQIAIPGAGAAAAAPAGLDAGLGLPPSGLPGVSPPPAPVPPPPSFKDDLFYSPYDTLPAAPAAGAPLGLVLAVSPRAA